ncbi:MAG TPA: DUF2304 domain-containing protein [Pirellulaceae bacterium]|nr:DUF2304 domain-containing protein [Pirellulaceae bacterium]
MNAPTLMLIGGVVAFLMTIHWVRSRDLRERYAIGWLSVAVLLLLCGLFPDVIMHWAEAAHLSYSSAVLFVSLAAIYCFALFVSVTLTHQHRRSVRLLQEVALLSQRLRMLEAERESAQAPIEDEVQL